MEVCEHATSEKSDHDKRDSCFVEVRVKKLTDTITEINPILFLRSLGN